MPLKYYCPKCSKRFVDWGAEKLDFKCPDCEDEKLYRVGTVPEGENGSSFSKSAPKRKAKAKAKAKPKAKAKAKAKAKDLVKAEVVDNGLDSGLDEAVADSDDSVIADD